MVTAPYMCVCETKDEGETREVLWEEECEILLLVFIQLFADVDTCVGVSVVVMSLSYD